MTTVSHPDTDTFTKPRVSKYIKEVIGTSDTFAPKLRNSLLSQHSRPFIRDGVLWIKANCFCGKKGVILTFSDFLYSRTCGCGVKAPRLSSSKISVLVDKPSESPVEDIPHQTPAVEEPSVSEVLVQPKKRGRKPKVIDPVVDVVAVPKKRGRKPKVVDPVVDVVAVPKKRGRPPNSESQKVKEVKSPKKRGRPPKISVSPTDVVNEPKKRGRPRKNDPSKDKKTPIKKERSSRIKGKIANKSKVKPPRQARLGIDATISDTLPVESADTYIYTTNSQVRSLIRSIDSASYTTEKELFDHYTICTSSSCNHPIVPSGRAHYAVHSLRKSKLSMVSNVYSSYGILMAEFECSCGTKDIHLSLDAFKYRMVSCGCEKPVSRTKLSSMHQSYLTATKKPFTGTDGRVYVLCRCVCGKRNIKITLAKFLYVSKSCGCKGKKKYIPKREKKRT